jgi:serine protease Do
LAAGLLVEFASGAGRSAGVRPGDLLLAVNGRPVATVEQLRAVVADAEPLVALLILRDGDRRFVPVSTREP